MKILTVIGARPQFIKSATVSRVIRKYNDSTNTSKKLEEVIVHTGQHYDRNMSDIFFFEMDIPRPNYFLNIHGIGHGAMTGQMLEKIETVMEDEKPDITLVYGDTNTTLAGALSAVKLHIPVAHVEAGLRSYNRCMPEEINRIMADHISQVLFCPTDAALANLKAEGIGADGSKNSVRVVRTGDVMLDAALYYAKKSRERATACAPGSDLDIFLRKAEAKNGFALCTVHRAENADNPDRLKGIFRALGEIGNKTPVILPLHPRTKKMLKTLGLEHLAAQPSIRLIDPVGYFDILELLKRCCLVLTDSGGLQKEAYFFHKACVTLRDETEWVELVENGVNVLAGATTERILDGRRTILEKDATFETSLYGNGSAAEQIFMTLIQLQDSNIL